jgi:pilus assembly protein CpaF
LSLLDKLNEKARADAVDPGPVAVRPFAPAQSPAVDQTAESSTRARIEALAAQPTAVPTQEPDRAAALSISDAQRRILVQAKEAIHNQLLDRYSEGLQNADTNTVQARIAELVEEYMGANRGAMRGIDQRQLLEELYDDVLGLGPLEPLLRNPEVTEIMINSPFKVYVEAGGMTLKSTVTFGSTKALMRVIDRVVQSVGRRVDETTPMCDARLADGSRVNVIIPPLALNGPCMTIRKFTKEKLGPLDLVRFGTATPDIMRFLDAAVRSRFSMLISGGASSGKTTLLNVLSGFIPNDERIVTCEDSAELQLQQIHVITLESRPPNVEGAGAVVIRDLVKNCLRMRPDRIIIGECRGGEALDMLQAMNTGHEGSMSTLHANTPRESMSRLETLVLMAGTDLPSRAIREQMASAVHFIVQVQKLRGGIRRLTSIAEVNGITGDDISIQDIFTFKQVGVSPGGKAIGYHSATGIRPARMEAFRASGQDLPDEIFEPTPEPPYEELY